jgi:hypothetical protein
MSIYTTVLNEKFGNKRTTTYVILLFLLYNSNLVIYLCYLNILLIFYCQKPTK